MKKIFCVQKQKNIIHNKNPSNGEKQQSSNIQPFLYHNRNINKPNESIDNIDNIIIEI